MLATTAQGTNIYYRGYVIHEDIRAICYTIYDRRPARQELMTVGNSRAAMRWVDARINIEARLEDTGVSVAEILSLARAVAVA